MTERDWSLSAVLYWSCKRLPPGTLCYCIQWFLIFGEYEATFYLVVYFVHYIFDSICFALNFLIPGNYIHIYNMQCFFCTFFVIYIIRYWIFWQNSEGCMGDVRVRGNLVSNNRFCVAIFIFVMQLFPFFFYFMTGLWVLNFILVMFFILEYDLKLCFSITFIIFICWFLIRICISMKKFLFLITRLYVLLPYNFRCSY